MSDEQSLFHKTPVEAFGDWQRRAAEATGQLFRAAACQLPMFQNYMTGFQRYMDDFMTPYTIAQDAFAATERTKLQKTALAKSVSDYNELALFNLQVAEKGARSTLQAMSNAQSPGDQRALRVSII